MDTILQLVGLFTIARIIHAIVCLITPHQYPDSATHRNR